MPLFDRVCLWLEHKGWLYYRNNKPQTGIIGSALQELNAQLQPDTRHVIMAQQEVIQSKKSEADSPSDNQTIANQFATSIKNAYDAIAEIWYEKRDWYIEQGSIDELMAILKPGAKILDIGCGSGKPIALYLKNSGFDVYGMDISSQQIAHAKQIIPEDKLVTADICNFSITMQFDAIACWCTLFHIHVNHHVMVLKKLYDLLAPEGLLLVTFADTNHGPEGEFKQIDKYTIESAMFGENFYHSGQPAEKNSQVVLRAGFCILSEKNDQPDNQVILARKN